MGTMRFAKVNRIRLDLLGKPSKFDRGVAGRNESSEVVH